MKILQVDLISSTPGATSLRSSVRSQIVFVGRSNVGKSSLINALIRRKLARTSRSPGKTDLVNIYRVRLAITANQVDTIDFVDLPGYGYVRGGSRRAESFAKITEKYFRALSEPPRAAGSVPSVLHLVDSRHSDLKSDRDAHAWLENQGLTTITVGTKADSLPRAEQKRVAQVLGSRTGGRVLLVSAKSGNGLQDLWKMILQVSDRR